MHGIFGHIYIFTQIVHLIFLLIKTQTSQGKTYIVIMIWFFLKMRKHFNNELMHINNNSTKGSKFCIYDLYRFYFCQYYEIESMRFFITIKLVFSTIE